MDQSTDHLEWVAKADGDAEGARMLLREYKPEIAHLIAFSCQQAAEKYLKAILIHDKVHFPRTHDLVQLKLLCSARRPDITGIEEPVAFLAPFAVNVRYPGFEADRATCERAFEHMRRVQSWSRRVLGLQAPP